MVAAQLLEQRNGIGFWESSQRRDYDIEGIVWWCRRLRVALCRTSPTIVNVGIVAAVRAVDGDAS